MMKFTCYFLLLFLSLLLTKNVLANDSHTILNGVDDVMDRLITGVVTVHGTVITKVHDKIPETKNVEYLIAFDYSKGNYRFDTKGTGRYLRTPEYQYEAFQQRFYTVVRKNLTEKIPIALAPFDIKALGFFSLHGNPSNARYFPLSPLEISNLYTIDLRDQKDVSIVNMNPSNDSKHKLSSFKLWIDTNKNLYNIVHIEVSNFQKSDLSWKQMNNTSIPVTFSGHYGYSGSPLQIDMDLTFDWELVNEKIPERYFAVDDLVGEKGEGELVTYELDGARLRLETIHERKFTNKIQPKSWSYFNYILITAGLIMILIGLTKMGYDRWVRNSQI